MWKWFKRKNAQAEIDKEKGTTKINAGDVAVEVDGRKITVAELQDAMITAEAEEAEQAKKAELEKELEPVSMEDTFLASNGKEYKIGDLVANWKKRNEGKAVVDEKAAKEAEDKQNAISRADAENLFEDYAREKGGSDGEAFFDNPDLLTPQAISAWLKGKGKEQSDVNAIIGVWKSILQNKKNATKTPEELAAEKKEAEEKAAKENAAAEEAKVKAEEEAKAKEAAEKKENAKKEGKAFFKELHNASHASEGPVPVVGKSRAERARKWAEKSKKR